MNKIWSGEVFWTGRVLELRAREVPCLLAIGTALMGQQVGEQVTRPLKSFGRGVLIQGHVEHTV